MKEAKPMKNQGGDLEKTVHPLVAKYLRQERMPHMACPGCGIGQVVHSTLIACDELALTPENTVWVQGVGCSSRITYTLWKGDNIDAHHGRIFAVATGLKLSRPDLNYICFTGDGDCMSIGGNHFLHACRRNLDVTAIMFNNAIYGMTGGQMAPTTLLGQEATTAPMGRDAKLHGHPIDISRMLAICDGAVYIERCTLASIKQIRQAKKAIRKSFQCQLDHLGFSLVELLSPCPTNWKLSPKEAFAWVNEVMTKTYPIGVIKDTTGYEDKK
jgi:2-oxoglutarate ferredoxin oxidoreductase subunit beta